MARGKKVVHLASSCLLRELSEWNYMSVKSFGSYRVLRCLVM